MPTLLTFALLLAAPAPQLPLKAVVLYENGLGYFERRGRLPATGVADIPLEAGQLDDALKSLVVMSQRGVASVEFSPPLAAEAARASAGLPAPEEQTSLVSLLRALKGVEVTVALRQGALRGRVVEVSEAQELDAKGNSIPAPELMVFGEAGLQRLSLRELRAVRPVDPAVKLAWERATGAAAQQPERSGLKVRGTSTGEGLVSVGYTTEAPVWRTTYRLILGKGQERLQGFALVHNDSDEPWEGVKVTLASGRPSSFLFPLAGPRYTRRELVAPADGLDVSPQLVSEEAREHLRGPLAAVGGSGHLGSIGVGAGGSGYGSGGMALGSAGTLHGAAAGGDRSSALEDGPTPLEPAALSEAGELFLYTVAEPVFLGARHSALLPIIDAKSGAERVTEIALDGAAALAVRLHNTAGMTLEGGTVSVFTDGAYAGECQVSRLKPGEVRVLKHGEDLDVEVARSSETVAGPVKLLRKQLGAGKKGSGELLELHRVDRLTHRLAVTSRSERPRVLLVALPHEGYRVTGGAEEDVRSPGEPRYARVALEPKAEQVLEVVEQGAFVQRVPVESLGSAFLEDQLGRPGLLAPMKAALEKLLAQTRAVEAQESARQALDAQLSTLEKDVARLRENLGALGKGGARDAADETGARLVKTEESLAALRAAREKAVAGVAAARLELLAKVDAVTGASPALRSAR